MSRTSPLLTRCVLLAFGAGIFAGCTTTIRLNPHFQERREKIKTIGAIPGEAEITFVKFKGDNERMREEEARVCRDIEEAVREELVKQGFTVSDQRITIDSGSASSLNEDERFKLTALQKAADLTFGKLYDKPAYSSACTLSVGAEAEVNTFADKLKSDAVVFVRMAGFRKSGGQQSADMTKTCLIAALSLGSSVVVYYPEGGAMMVMLVDGNNGEVLWANTAGSQGSIADNAMVSMVKAAFKGFPKVKIK